MVKTVFVKGNIIADCGYHTAKYLECPSHIEDSETADEVIEGDLHLNEEKKLCPYCKYIASKGITAIDGNIGCFANPSCLQKELSGELQKIKELSHIDTPHDLQQILYKSLYGAVFGCFEVFITTLLTNMVLGDKDNYDRFLLYIRKANYMGNDINTIIFKEICKFNAHNMGVIKDLFENVFKINYPDYSVLGKAIKKRHDVIHRSGRNVVSNHLESVNFSTNDIEILILQINDFVSRLLEEMKEPIKKWEEQ